MVRFPPPEWMQEHPEVSRFKYLVESIIQNIANADLPLLSPTSWYREKGENDLVLGQPFSLHLVGLGMDLDWMGATLNQYKAVAYLAMTQGLSCIIYMTSTKHYIHVQWLGLATDAPPQYEIPFGDLRLWLTLVWEVVYQRDRLNVPATQVITDAGSRIFYLDDLKEFAQAAGLI